MEVKKLAVVAIGLTFSAVSAFGGVVSFDPAAIQVNLAGRGPMDIAVSINPDTSAFDAATVLIGSPNVPIIGLSLSPAWNGPGAFTAVEGPIVAPGTGVYPYEAYFGGNIAAPGILNFDTLLGGTLRVDLTDLPEGTYTIGVDSDADGGISGIGNRGTLEALRGSVAITIVPEPATLSLLGLGLLAAIRRRRTA